MLKNLKSYFRKKSQAPPKGQTKWRRLHMMNREVLSLKK